MGETNENWVIDVIIHTWVNAIPYNNTPHVKALSLYLEPKSSAVNSCNSQVWQGYELFPVLVLDKITNTCCLARKLMRWERIVSWGFSGVVVREKLYSVLTWTRPELRLQAREFHWASATTTGMRNVAVLPETRRRPSVAMPNSAWEKVSHNHGGIMTTIIEIQRRVRIISSLRSITFFPMPLVSLWTFWQDLHVKVALVFILFNFLNVQTLFSPPSQ